MPNAPREQGFVLRDKHDNARPLMQRDANSLSSSYTRSYGFVMERGQGSTMWDVDGHEYLDFAAGIAVLSTGHAHPKVIEAVTKQAQKYVHIGATDFYCPAQVELAERLQKITPINGAENPEDKRVYFGNSGTEAIEAALKLARYRENRNYIIGFYGSFHGRSYGSLSVTASKYVQRANYPYIPGGVEHVPYPGKWGSERAKNDSYDWGDVAQYIEDFVLKRKLPAKEVAAILVEPIQGEGGYVVPRDDFFPKLRALCDRHGILLIVDEIQSGVGRTGNWWAVEDTGVKPDIVCTAKGLGSGFPISGIIAHKDVMGQWIPGAHASTFGGNPVACAAALATLDVIEEEGLLHHAAALGEYGIGRLSEFMKSHPSIVRVDGRGLMIGIEFLTPDGKPAAKFRDEVVDHAFLHGLVTLACGASTLRICPPLVIRRDEFERGLDILERVIAHCEETYYEAQA